MDTSRGCTPATNHIDVDKEGRLIFNATLGASVNDQILYIKDGNRMECVAGGGILNEENSIDSPLRLQLRFFDSQFLQDGTIRIITIGSDNKRRASFLASASVGGATGFNAIASKNGEELFLFDDDNLHQKTVDAITGNSIWDFTYDSSGLLISMTDRFGAVTQIERDSNGSATAIVSPDGLRTGLTIDGTGSLVAIENSNLETYSMTYELDTGLLKSFEKPKGNTSFYSYFSDGKLMRAENGAGGFQDFTQDILSTSQTITRQTSLGRTEIHLSGALAEPIDTPRFSRQETSLLRLTRSDGTVEDIESVENNSTIFSSDGTITRLDQIYERRFGFAAPDNITSTELPSGTSLNIFEQTEVENYSGFDYLDFDSVTKNIIINGDSTNPFRTTYFKASNHYISQTPEGRQTVSQLNSAGLVESVSIPNISNISYSYDAKGRVASVSQGTRSLSFAYNNEGFLESTTDNLNRTTNYEYDGTGRVTKVTLPDLTSTALGYDLNGNLNAVTPPGRPTHSFSYGTLDLVNQYDPPLLPSTTNQTLYDWSAPPRRIRKYVLQNGSKGSPKCRKESVIQNKMLEIAKPIVLHCST